MITMQQTRELADALRSGERVEIGRIALRLAEDDRVGITIGDRSRVVAIDDLLEQLDARSAA